MWLNKKINSGYSRKLRGLPEVDTESLALAFLKVGFSSDECTNERFPGEVRNESPGSIIGVSKFYYHFSDVVVDSQQLKDSGSSEISGLETILTADAFVEFASDSRDIFLFAQ